MNILYITLDPLLSSSSASERNNLIIKGLVELDYSIDIITIGQNPYETNQKIKVFSLNRSDKYVVISRHTIIKKLIRNIYYKFSLFDNTISLKNAKVPSSFFNNHYDYIISSSDPKTSHILAKNIIEREHLSFSKWIQYWGDPLTGDISNKTIWPKKTIISIERKIYNNCTSIVFVSPFTLITQQNNHPKIVKRMQFVPVPHKYIKTFEHKENNGNILKFGYFGSYYSNIRNILPTYEAFINQKSNILKIAGNSNINLQSRVNIEILDNQPLSLLNKLEFETDVYICILNKKGTQIPGKLYHYAGTTKPIIVILDGDYKSEMRKYIESFNRFIVCDNTVEDIVSVLSEKTLHQKYEPTKKLDKKVIAEMILKSQSYRY